VPPMAHKLHVLWVSLWMKYPAAYAHVMPRDACVPQFLMDAYHPWEVGGTGIVADWAVGLVLARSYRLMLAGGLTPETVAEAIKRVQPWGVDVSSGVERENGRKDHARIRAFVEAVRAADEALHAQSK